jgi:hypothetical protein
MGRKDHGQQNAGNLQTHFQKAYKKYIKSQETLHAAGITNNAMIQAGVESTQTDVANLVAITSNT